MWVDCCNNHGKDVLLVEQGRQKSMWKHPNSPNGDAGVTCHLQWWDGYRMKLCTTEELDSISCL